MDEVSGEAEEPSDQMAWEGVSGGNCIELAFKEIFPAFSPCGTNRKRDQLAGSLGQMGKAALGWEHRPGRIPVAPAPSGCNSESESEVVQLRPTLCDPVDCSPPGSSVHGILQARIPEWVAISFSR